MVDRRMLSRRLLGVLLVPSLLIAAVAIWFATDPGFRTSVGPPKATSRVPRDEFEQRIRTYLLENPEVIVEAMQQLQARERAAEVSEAQAVLKARAEEVFRDPESPVGGNPDGDVTLVEFLDYNCPYCRRVAPVMIEAEKTDSQLRIVYKEFPILGPNSLFAAKAALAAHRQGQYVAFHKALMQADGVANENTVLAIAAEVGLDVVRLKADMQDPAIQEAIDRNLALAQALRINGTPGFVVGQQILRGATDLSALQGLIRQARSEQ
jgi:protein-disulfide isomerase